MILDEAHIAPDRDIGASHIFIAMLVHCQVDCTKGSSPYLLLDDILIDTVDGRSIIFAVRVLGASVQSLFNLSGG